MAEISSLSNLLLLGAEDLSQVSGLVGVKFKSFEEFQKYIAEIAAGKITSKEATKIASALEGAATNPTLDKVLKFSGEVPPEFGVGGSNVPANVVGAGITPGKAGAAIGPTGGAVRMPLGGGAAGGLPVAAKGKGDLKAALAALLGGAGGETEKAAKAGARGAAASAGWEAVAAGILGREVHKGVPLGRSVIQEVWAKLYADVEGLGDVKLRQRLDDLVTEVDEVLKAKGPADIPTRMALRVRTLAEDIGDATSKTTKAAKAAGATAAAAEEVLEPEPTTKLGKVKKAIGTETRGLPEKILGKKVGGWVRKKPAIAGGLGYLLMEILGRVGEQMDIGEMERVAQAGMVSRSPDEVLEDLRNQRAGMRRAVEFSQGTDPSIIQLLENFGQTSRSPSRVAIGPPPVLGALSDGSMTIEDLLAQVR